MNVGVKHGQENLAQKADLPCATAPRKQVVLEDEVDIVEEE